LVKKKLSFILFTTTMLDHNSHFVKTLILTFETLLVIRQLNKEKYNNLNKNLIILNLVIQFCNHVSQSKTLTTKYQFPKSAKENIAMCKLHYTHTQTILETNKSHITESMTSAK